MLPVDELHTLYWEECRNPEGVPVVYLHGGPGEGAPPSSRQFWDPDHYRIVLFDQRDATTRPKRWSAISKRCVNTWASSAGWSPPGHGERPWRWPFTFGAWHLEHADRSYRKIQSCRAF